MKNLIKILIVITSLSSYYSFGQVTTSINQVYVNSQTTVTNCSLIDFGSTSNNTLTIYYKLTKPLNQVVSGNLRIKLKYSSSTNGTQKSSIPIQSTSWIDNTQSNISTNEATIPCNISESEIQVTGSSIYIEFTTDSGAITSSCEYPLQKTQVPVFTLSPTSTTVGCSSTSPYTFSVANVYNSPGTLTYSWNTSGWTGTVNPSLSSVTLTPSSLTSLPSNVSVTPYLNGVAQPTRICTVTRASFSSSATVSGNSALCSSSTYSINGLLAGQSVTLWSLSNPSIASLSTTSGNSTTLTKIGDGSVTLTATITNSCGQTTTKSMNLLLGTANPPGTISGPASVATGALVTYSVASVPGATSYLWYLPYPYDTLTNFNYSGQRWQKRTNSSSSNTIQVYTGLGGISGLIQVMAVNGCGTSGARTMSVAHGGSGGGNPRMSNPNVNTGIKIYPNPATNIINIELVDQNIKTDSNIKAILYDPQGTEIQRVEIINSTAKINVENLPSGIYVISLNIGGKIESHKIYVE